MDHQDLALKSMYKQTGSNQHELMELVEQLGGKSLSDEYVNQIVSVIERGMNDFQSKFPQAEEVINAWKTASMQLNLTSDSKIKLKWTIPFIFCSLEKEYSWNGWEWFHSIREDIRKGRQGKWHEMFLE